MDNWFKSRWFVRAISLAFAAALYMFVQIESDQYQNESRLPSNANADIQTIENVPVNIRIDEDEFVVSGVPEVAAVSLEGSIGTLTTTARNQNFDLYVDLEDMDPGTHTVDLKHTGIPDDLNVYIEPKTIEVTIEERASKTFPVTVDYIKTDELPKGYQIDSAQADPEQVMITTSKDVIDQIAIIKAFVDVSEQKESIDSREVPVKVYDASGNELNARVEPPNTNVSVQISHASKSVPVSVETTGELPDGYSLASKSAGVKNVTVYAESDTLQKIEKVSTEKINLADITESGTINATLDLPDDVTTVSGKDTVQVTIKLDRSKTVKNVPINVENLDDGQDISFINPESPKMDLTVTGSQTSVSKVSKDDFHISLNAAKLEKGQHDVAISVKGPDLVDISGKQKEATIKIS
ncbi:CdaR family protein [Lentibacillus halophilus]|uniref:CdaR family protein n=1 Tax=Lentibacillus halophilus TaxID=295065 RepID=A0ABN0Z2X5_9BACI